MTRVYTPEERIAWMKSLHGNPSGAAMLLETPDKKLLIVKANYKNHWTLPGGVVDKGESPLQAALRETREEVGLIIDQKSVEFAGVTFCHGSDVDVYRFIFRCQITERQVRSITLQESEIEEYALEGVEQVKSSLRQYAPNIITWANEEPFPTYGEEQMFI